MCICTDGARCADLGFCVQDGPPLKGTKGRMAKSLADQIKKCDLGRACRSTASQRRTESELLMDLLDTKIIDAVTAAIQHTAKERSRDGMTGIADDRARALAHAAIDAVVDETKGLEPRIEYAELNDAARFLFDNARGLGYRQGEADRESKAAVDNTVRALECALPMLHDALNAQDPRIAACLVGHASCVVSKTAAAIYVGGMTSRFSSAIAPDRSHIKRGIVEAIIKVGRETLEAMR